jgi:hypothetical protein
VGDAEGECAQSHGSTQLSVPLYEGIARNINGVPSAAIALKVSGPDSLHPNGGNRPRDIQLASRCVTARP